MTAQHDRPAPLSPADHHPAGYQSPEGHPAGHQNGGLAVIATLAAHGVDTIFGIPGTHNLEFYRHLPHYGITAITPRHEQGAGYAADGYYLLSGRPGVVITTSGPGLTNVITAAATAYAESRPMLILSPGVPTGMEGADAGLLHETKDSSGALSRLLVVSRRARTAEGAAQAVAEAFALFASGRPGPIHIEVPLDVLEGPWWGTAPRPLPAAPPQATTETVQRAAALLRDASRPLIVAGGGARTSSRHLTALAELLDAPVATTSNGKGVLDETHPLALGASVRFAAVQEESRLADVLLVLGTELADSDLWGGTIGAARSEPMTAGSDRGQRVIRCDIDPDQLNKNLLGDVLVHSDAEVFLTALLNILTSPADGDRADTASADTASADSASADSATGTASAGSAADTGPSRTGHQRAAAVRAQYPEEFDFGAVGALVTRAVAEAAGPEVVIAGDSSQVTYDGTMHTLQATRVDQVLYMPGFATLGYGIPAALGAKIAAPDRAVVAVLGDGAAMFSVQEVMTAVELGLAIAFVIVDNGGYAEIEEQMSARGISPFAVRLARPDFALLGEAMGAAGATIEIAPDDPDFVPAVRRAVEGALSAAGPTVIHIKVTG